jgi:hypothetical protein
MIGDLQDLTYQVTKTDQYPFARGGFADIFAGEWKDPFSGDLKPVSSCNFAVSHDLIKCPGRHQMFA